MEQTTFILIDPLDPKPLWPLTQTRPLGELRLGIMTLFEKWAHMLNCPGSHLTQTYLSQKYPIQCSTQNYLIDGSLIPDLTLVESILNLDLGQCLVNTEGNFLGAFLNLKTMEDLIHSKNLNQHVDLTTYSNQIVVYKTNPIKYLSNTWEVFQWNEEELIKDYQLLTKDRISEPIDPSNRIFGTQVFIEAGAKVRGCMINSETGPVYIAKNAEIMEGSMIRGPFALCEGSTIKMGAKIYGATTIGPHSKVGGEVNNSVILGNSNKAHDGFLGNAVVGEWCNIGADTNNSNLKNTYQEVKLWDYSKEGFRKTGTIFCGLILGDHVKCGINTMFNTGTVVGFGANVFGSSFPRQFIPDFAWGGASGFETFPFNKFLDTAKAVFSRRNAILSDLDISIYQHIFQTTAPFRSWE